MRLFSYISVAALFVSCGLSAVVSATQCDLVASSVVLKKIEADADVAECSKLSGVSLQPPKGMPSPAQLDKFCAEDVCRTALKTLQQLDLPSCSIALINNINLRQIVDAFGSHCAKPGKQPAAAYGQGKAAQGSPPVALAVEAPGPKGVSTSAPSPNPAAYGAAPVPTKQPAAPLPPKQADVKQQPLPTPAASRPSDAKPSKPALRHCM
ncbi:hypothetical protein P43SY_010866 [Pythium insidiosum]|uniref:Elicitin-like protein n=1 Tax=Pythium insidiosum TaxID=114742 RepID=A0AAD5L7M5_PYTIN|nr:hypothetical protein P43SY_010866 [Pythium insidiosum]